MAFFIRACEAMTHNGIRFEKMLAALKRYRFLADYNLTVYCEKEGTGKLRPCGSIIRSRLKNNIYDSSIESQARSAYVNNTPFIFRCNGGYLRFVVPYRSAEVSFCLIGDGVREKSIDLWQLEELSKNSNISAFSLRQDLENLPATTFQEVRRAAGFVLKLLPSHVEDKLYKYLYDRNMARIGMVARILPELDALPTMDDTLSLSCELLGFLVEFAKIAVVLRNKDDNVFSMIGKWGLDEQLGTFPERKLAELVSPETAKKPVKLDDEFRKLFPRLDEDRAIFFPLKKEGELLGAVVIFDHKPHPADIPLIELVTDRIAEKIARLAKENDLSRQNHLANRLIELQNSFIGADSADDLYRCILESAMSLVNSSRGSIMLVNECGRSLFIKLSKGIKPQIAQLISVGIGEGIAGKVAESGIPLLVNDIEKDARVEMRNRPRFKTKSLLCVPLKINGKVAGVLNLSDKEDLGTFSRSDLDHLLSMTGFASLMLERAMALEKSLEYEKLSLTDHLTGLCNRRYLEERFAEEISRSNRQGLNFSVMMIDVDNFKAYNDRYGHLAGDGALKKIAGIIRASLRDMDTVARYGGDEFCVILPATSKNESLAIAERIKRDIDGQRSATEEIPTLSLLTVSGGISTFPEDGTTVQTLIRAADTALYEAKEKGRNSIAASPNRRKDAV